MHFHLLEHNIKPVEFTTPTTLVVGSPSASATRDALAIANQHESLIGVIGWVDISSPNLVDLLEELTTGPGGDKLRGLRATGFDQQPDALPVTRGLSTVVDHGLELWLDADDSTSSTEDHVLAIGSPLRLPQLP